MCTRNGFATCKVCGIEVLALTKAVAKEVENATPMQCYDWHGGDPACRELALRAM